MMDNATFERVLAEYEALSEKTTKLREFLMDQDRIANLDDLNRDLLITQLKAMEAYLSILTIRIGLNAPRTAPIAEPVAETAESAEEVSE